jgi:hypothetical protein
LFQGASARSLQVGDTGDAWVRIAI